MERDGLKVKGVASPLRIGLGKHCSVSSFLTCAHPSSLLSQESVEISSWIRGAPARANQLSTLA